MTQNVDDFFGGSQSLSFADEATKGVKRGGLIVDDPTMSQQTDMQSGEPVFWPDGKPKMQVVVKLQTDEADPDDTFDDGVRALYVKGDLQRAVAQALREAGAKGLRKGGTLMVAWVGEEPAKTRGFNPKKLYAAQYSPPEPGAATDAVFSHQEPAQAAPQPQQATAANPFV